LDPLAYWSIDIGGLPLAWQIDFANLDFLLTTMDTQSLIRCVSGKGGCGDHIDCDIGDGCAGYCDPFTKRCNYSDPLTCVP
jgi:hypothetical protein